MHHFNNLIEHFGYFGIFIALVGGILAGINGYSIKRFSLFAFTGVALWCITFITLGNFLGPQWKIVHNYVSKYGMYIFALGIFVVVIVSIIFWQKRGEQKKAFTKNKTGVLCYYYFRGHSMCNLVGIGIGLFFVLMGGVFLYLNTKDEPKSLRLISLFSFESGAILYCLLII